LIHQWWWWWYVNSQGYHQFNNKIVIVLFTLICLFTIFAVISNCELYKSRNSSAIRVFVFLIWFLGVLSYIILMFWSLSVSHQHLTFWLQLVRHCSWMFWLPLIRHNHLSLCLSFHSIAALQCEGLAFICTTSSYNGLVSIRLALPLDVISFNPTDITI
jgi:hypothetical protein